MEKIFTLKFHWKYGYCMYVDNLYLILIFSINFINHIECDYFRVEWYCEENGKEIEKSK